MFETYNDPSHTHQHTQLQKETSVENSATTTAAWCTKQLVLIAKHVGPYFPYTSQYIDKTEVGGVDCQSQTCVNSESNMFI